MKRNLAIRDSVALGWAHEEDAIIREHAGRIIAAKISEMLPGRTPDAIRTRAIRIGVSLKPRPSLTLVSKPKIEDCRRAVQIARRVRKDEILSDSHEHRVAHARQEAMVLARQFTGRSTTEIGYYLGGKDHTTVIHAERAVQMREDESLPYASDMWHMRLAVAVFAAQKSAFAEGAM